MSIKLDDFIKKQGLSGVVSISHDWREEAGGYQNEHLTEEIVCRTKAGKHRYMKIYWYMRTMGATDRSVLEDRVITKEEYEAFRKKHGPYKG